ncbi:MAG: hypothetical protein KF718_20175 [Polyangiaceae bacterium]|nr:hypothetical protein [Polyangiaceae bacterium]
MTPERRRQGLLALAAVGAALGYWLLVPKRSPTASVPSQPPATPRGPKATPRRPPPGDGATAVEPRAWGRDAGAASLANTGAGVMADGGLLTPHAPTPPRVEQLRMAVLQHAVRHDWVTIDDRDTPCPPERIRIVYEAPSNIADYDRGAYFEPLGPAPTESSEEINGLLVCDGYTFLYRGFEAYFRPERGQWEVFPFPVIE